MAGWAWQSALASVPRLHLSWRYLSLPGWCPHSNGTVSVRYRSFAWFRRIVPRGNKLLLMQKTTMSHARGRWHMHEYASLLMQKTTMSHARGRWHMHEYASLLLQKQRQRRQTCRDKHASDVEKGKYMPRESYVLEKTSCMHLEANLSLGSTLNGQTEIVACVAAFFCPILRSV
jgi:hypothetical protein